MSRILRYLLFLILVLSPQISLGSVEDADLATGPSAEETSGSFDPFAADTLGNQLAVGFASGAFLSWLGRGLEGRLEREMLYASWITESLLRIFWFARPSLSLLPVSSLASWIGWFLGSYIESRREAVNGQATEFEIFLRDPVLQREMWTIIRSMITLTYVLREMPRVLEVIRKLTLPVETISELSSEIKDPSGIRPELVSGLFFTVFFAARITAFSYAVWYVAGE